MAEIILGGSRFDQVKSHAFWHNKHLDTRLAFNPDNIDDTLEHLKDCNEHPTIGLIARRKTLENGPYYPYHYKKNKAACFNVLEVKTMNDIFESTYKKLYPKTGKIRQILIDNKRINFSEVMPKLKPMEKFIFGLKNIIK